MTVVDDVIDDQSTADPRHTHTVTWDTAIWAGTILLISWSLVGLGLAAAGWFRPVPVLVGTFIVAAAGFIWIRPSIARSPAPIRPHWLLTLAVLVLAAGAGLWNGAHHGEHLVAERDPGVYAATGLWLANEGNLRVAAPQGPFYEAPGVMQTSIGFSPNSAGSLDAQFVHLNAVFLAGGAWLGSTTMFLVPAFLMAVALVLIYALGVRLGHPFGGAYGAFALAVSYPYVFLARDTYSESVALVLLLAGLWALTFVRRSGMAPAVVAGALLGATCMARVDGYVPLIPLAGVIGLEAMVAHGRSEQGRAKAYVAAWLAMAVCAIAGTWEGWAFSRSYFDTNLAGRLPAMAGAIVAATIAGAIAGRFGIKRPPARENAVRVVRWGYGLAAAIVVAFLVWARFIRPDFEGLRAAMARNLAITDLSPWADTISYFWLEWYLGPILVAGSFVALLWMLWRSLDQDDRLWLGTACVGFSTTILYLIAPSITPDQPWVTRRFMAVPIPIMLLAAGIGLASLARIRRPWSIVGASALGLAALIAPAHFTHRLQHTAVGASLATRFDEICDVAHRRPSAILVTPNQALSYTVTETLRGWCNVPVAGAAPNMTAAQIQTLAQEWKDDGRQLLLLATSTEGFAGVTGPSVGVPGPILMGPEYTIDRPPSRLAPDGRVAQSGDGKLPLFVIEVNADRGTTG